MRLKYYFKNECKGFIRVSKHEKTDGSIVFECLKTLVRPDVQLLKQLLNRASGIKENGNIHEFFTRCRKVCCYEKMHCYGGLSKSNLCFQPT